MGCASPWNAPRPGSNARSILSTIMIARPPYELLPAIDCDLRIGRYFLRSVRVGARQRRLALRPSIGSSVLFP
jgi:hypothetical protein